MVQNPFLGHGEKKLRRGHEIVSRGDDVAFSWPQLRFFPHVLKGVPYHGIWIMHADNAC